MNDLCYESYLIPYFDLIFYHYYYLFDFIFKFNSYFSLEKIITRIDIVMLGISLNVDLFLV